MLVLLEIVEFFFANIQMAQKKIIFGYCWNFAHLRYYIIFTFLLFSCFFHILADFRRFFVYC